MKRRLFPRKRTSRRMKRLIRIWLLRAGVRRRTAYQWNALHRLAQRNIEAGSL